MHSFTAQGAFASLTLSCWTNTAGRLADGNPGAYAPRILPTLSKDGLAIHCKVEELAGVHSVPPQLNMPQAHTPVQHCAVHFAPVCPTATPLPFFPARLEAGMVGSPGCWTRLQLGCVPTVGG